MDFFRPAALLALLMVCASNASALPVPHPRENAVWKKLCFEVRKDALKQLDPSPPQPESKKAVEACFTYADLGPEPDITIGIVGVLQIPASGRSFLVAFFACDAEPRESGILLDDAPGKPEYLMPTEQCDAACCYVRAEIPQVFLGRMKAAKAISFVAWRFEANRYSIPLPCCDFGAVLDGIPMPAEAQGEWQRKFKAALEQRFEFLTR